MHNRWLIVGLLILLPTLAGCQQKRLNQTHVVEIWEVGEPITANYGYYKGAWFFNYNQITFFDQGVYRIRATTVAAHGFSMDWDTREIEGEWQRDEDGQPMLRQKGGSFRRLDAIYPQPDPDLDPAYHHPGSPAIHNRLRQTYTVKRSDPWAIPPDASPLIVPDESAIENEPPGFPAPGFLPAPEETRTLPIQPFTPSE